VVKKGIAISVETPITSIGTVVTIVLRRANAYRSNLGGQVKVEMTCEKHPEYRAILRPRPHPRTHAVCPVCYFMYSLTCGESATFEVEGERFILREAVTNEVFK
jgi:hypothetical protein